MITHVYVSSVATYHDEGWIEETIMTHFDKIIVHSKWNQMISGTNSWYGMPIAIREYPR